MKKLLSVFCMALLAGGMIFTSCTKNWTVTVKANNDAWGTVTGGGTYADQATATISATPAQGYQFAQWSDGVKDNPRTITVTANATYTAVFEVAGPSVKVTFNNGVWDANTIQGRYYTSQGAWDIFSCKTTSQEYPMSDIAAFATATGNYTDVTTDGQNYNNGVVAWAEYYNETSLVDGNNTYYGDWWAKDFNLTVSAFDATALKMSNTVSATMFNAKEAFVDGVGFENASTAPMTVNMTNVEMTPSNSKAGMKKISTNLAVK
jgi:hypothetical protein